MANGAVILDVDGTLVDSNDAHARAWVDAFLQYGIAVPFEKVRRAIGMGGDKLMPYVVQLSEDSETGQEIGRTRSEIFKAKYLPHITAFPRVRDLIQRFREDELVLAVASSAKEDELEPLLEIAGVIEFINASTSSDDADRSKPDPDIVQAAVKRAGCEQVRTIMLGDTPYDIEAAARARIEVVGLECGGWRRQDLAGAVQVYTSPADLLDRYEQSVFARLRTLTVRTS